MTEDVFTQVVKNHQEHLIHAVHRMVDSWEMESAERMDTIRHIRYCNVCTQKFHEYQNIFYAMDRDTMEPVWGISLTGFGTEVRKRILHDESGKSWSIPLALRYATAALFFIGLLYLALTYSSDEPDSKIALRSETLTQHLIKEDWNKLRSILQNPKKIIQYADEQIPVPLLRERLEKLYQQACSVYMFIHRKVDIQRFLSCNLFGYWSITQKKQTQPCGICRNISKRTEV